MSDEILSEIEQKFISCVTQALDSVKMAENPEELDRYRAYLENRCLLL